MLQQVYIIFLKCGMGYAGISGFYFMAEIKNRRWGNPYRNRDYLLLPYYLFR